VCKVPYEVVTPGPAGRLVEIVDFDSTTGQWLPALNLDSNEVLIGRGLAPSERDLRSHQQMVYAVAMRVLEAFERGLGRPFDWLQRLILLPHGFEGSDAYFQFEPFSVSFGYFTADHPDPQRGNLEGQRIFTALSYDVVARQVCHPVMFGLRPADWNSFSFDVEGFHQGMADLFAILVRFSEPDVVARIIRTDGVDLQDTPLLKVAMQSGSARKDDDAVRSYPQPPDPATYRQKVALRGHGALLASAFLEAFWGPTASAPRICCGLTVVHRCPATSTPTSSGAWPQKRRLLPRGWRDRRSRPWTTCRPSGLRTSTSCARS
jgi:hypothetical protein